MGDEMELSNADRERLKQARENSQYPSTAKASQELVLELPRSERVSAKKLERIESGQTKTINAVLLAALCRIYEVRLEDIAPDLVEDSHVLRDLLKAQFAYFEETSLLAS